MQYKDLEPSQISELQCPICFETYNNDENKPYILVPCGHSLCYACIFRLNQSHSILKCPICKQVYQKYIKNYALIGILQQHVKSQYNSQILHIQSHKQETFSEVLNQNFEFLIQNFEIMTEGGIIMPGSFTLWRKNYYKQISPDNLYEFVSIVDEKYFSLFVHKLYKYFSQQVYEQRIQTEVTAEIEQEKQKGSQGLLLDLFVDLNSAKIDNNSEIFNQLIASVAQWEVVLETTFDIISRAKLYGIYVPDQTIQQFLKDYKSINKFYMQKQKDSKGIVSVQKIKCSFFQLLRFLFKTQQSLHQVWIIFRIQVQEILIYVIAQALLSLFAKGMHHSILLAKLKESIQMIQVSTSSLDYTNTLIKDKILQYAKENDENKKFVLYQDIEQLINTELFKYEIKTQAMQSHLDFNQYIAQIVEFQNEGQEEEDGWIILNIPLYKPVPLEESFCDFSKKQ